MVRMKMPRQNRAAQFAPFDALKGLSEAIKLKEYEHDRIALKELSEEQAKEISNVLENYVPGQILEITYFEDGYEKKIVCSPKINIIEGFLSYGDIKIEISKKVLLLKFCRNKTTKRQGKSSNRHSFICNFIHKFFSNRHNL